MSTMTNTVPLPARHPLAQAVALVSALGVSSVKVATFTVINANDSGDGSLRQAVTNANTAVGADQITFDLERGTIPLTTANQRLTLENLILSGGYTLAGTGFICAASTVLAANSGFDGNFKSQINSGDSDTLKVSFSLFGDDVREINSTDSDNVFSNISNLAVLTDNRCAVPTGATVSAAYIH